MRNTCIVHTYSKFSILQIELDQPQRFLDLNKIAKTKIAHSNC